MNSHLNSQLFTLQSKDLPDLISGVHIFNCKDGRIHLAQNLCDIACMQIQIHVTLELGMRAFISLVLDACP